MIEESKFERAMDLVDKRRANYFHFFRQLDDADWIPQLIAKGYFTRPPAAKNEGTSVSYERWPESEFLARVAAASPELVAETIARIPDTNNVLIHEDFAQAAASLPAGPAGEIADAEAKWIDRQQGQLDFGYPEAITNLILVLLEQDDWENARTLLRSILRTGYDDSTYFGSTTTKVDAWTYGDICRKVFPVAAERVHLEAVNEGIRLIDLVQRDQGLDPPHDFSGTWKPAVDRRGGDGSTDVRIYLVDAVREAALIAVGDQGALLSEVTTLLLGREWEVFRRIAVVVQTDRASLDPDESVRFALTESLLRDPDLLIEYAKLIPKAFGNFSEEQRSQWKALVEKGPDWPPQESNERRDLQISDDEYAGISGRWERDHLALLGGLIPEAWTARLKELEERWGPPIMPQIRARSSSWIGPTSPLTKEELDRMTGPEIVGFLDTWKPSGEAMAPSPDGLGRMVEIRIEENPTNFTPSLEEAAHLDPTYLGAILGGLEKAIKSGQQIDWSLAVGLCQVAARSIDNEPEVTFDAEDEDDPSWRWCRRAAASFLSEVFKHENLPDELRTDAWDAIKALSWDRDPTSEHEVTYGGDNMDPLSLSLNTVRGEAMHAMVQFAQSTKKRSPVPAEFSFGSEPDLKSELEAHLDPEHEPSETIRGVFGARLGELFLMDVEWTSQQKERLFPDGNDRLRLATWESYLSWGRPYALMFSFLESEYARAIKEIPESEDRNERAGREPGLALAEHLATHVWHGDINSDEDESLVAAFLEVARIPELKHFVDFLGRILEQLSLEEVGEERVDRMTRLWERIERTVGDRNIDQTVLAPFGLWFTSEVFPPEWADQVLTRLLGAGVDIEMKVKVVAAIQERGESDAAAAIQLIDAYVRNPHSRLRGMWLTNEIRSVLESGLRDDDPATREAASRTVNVLVANGLTGFRDLAEL